MTSVGGALGRYRLVGILGGGGFATVYRALDPALGREVALKALLPHLAIDADLRARFVAEARALAQLRHPNIVTVHDVGESDGQPFFTMELIEGVTLVELLDGGGGLPLDRAAEILRPLCSAVEYLHAAGVVHRDIKGANVMRDGFGRTVLMDFGVARVLGGTHHTRAGASLGTPETMAPEQVRGEAVGPPADIYALGVLAYQLLAGRPPFVGDTGYVLHPQIYELPPPLRTIRPGLPDRVYNTVEAMLAKYPGPRPTRASALSDSFRPVVDQRPSHVNNDGAPPFMGADPTGRAAAVELPPDPGQAPRSEAPPISSSRDIASTGNPLQTDRPLLASTVQVEADPLWDGFEWNSLFGFTLLTLVGVVSTILVVSLLLLTLNGLGVLP